MRIFLACLGLLLGGCVGAPGQANYVVPEQLASEWSAHSDYLVRFIGLVETEWKRGLNASQVRPPAGTVVAVKFIMDAEGRVARIVAVDNGSSDVAARACVAAVLSRAPYGSWSGAMEQSLGKQTEITLKFTYR